MGRDAGSQEHSRARLSGGTWAIAAATLLGFLVWFAGWGWLIDLLWRETGLPERASWGHFYRLWLPLSAYLLTAASILFSLREGRPVPACVARQAWASLPLVLFLGLQAGWRTLHPWPIWFGSFYVLSIVIRGAAFFRPLWRDPPAGLPGSRASLRIFVGSVLVYALLAPWVVRTLPTAGDEPHYLLITHSLVVDGDRDLRNNYQNRDYQLFHGSHLTPQGGETSVSFHGVGFPLLLAPGYAVAGRLGATWVVALVAALLSVNVYWFCLEMSASPSARLQAWAMTVFTVPIATYAHQLFPEVVAALGTLYTYRLFRAHPLPPAPALLRGVVTTLGVIFLKARYAPVAVGLWAYLLLRRFRARRGVWRWALAFLVLFAAFPVLDRLMFDGYLMLRRFGNPLQWLYLLQVNRFHLIGPAGLLVDQKAGLLMYSPVYVVAFVGLALLVRDRKPDGVVISTLGLTYLYLLIAHTQERWNGEFSPAPRYLVVVLPLLAGPMAVALTRCRGRLFGVTRSALAAYSFVVATVLIVMPRWRFRTRTGQSMVLQAVSQALSVNLVDWFPSFVAPTPYTFLVAGAGLALLGGLLLYFCAIAE